VANLGVSMGAQRHHRDHADVVQCEIQRDELDAVGELNDDAICDWETMWWGYITQWISSRSLFTTRSGLAE